MILSKIINLFSFMFKNFTMLYKIYFFPLTNIIFIPINIINKNKHILNYKNIRIVKKKKLFS